MCFWAGTINAGQLSQTAAAPQFVRDVAPIFEQSCKPCHIDAAMGKLRLHSEADLLQGGASGPAIVPGHSQDSLLIKRLLGLTDGPRMPMGGQPLSAVQIQALRRWIDQGQFQPQTGKPVETTQMNSTGAPSSALFAKEIRPILASRCYSCHGPTIQQSGLRLDSLTGVLKGSDYGPVVVPHQAEKSRLIRRLLAQDRPQMPYGGPPLSGEQIASIRKWIAAGAPGPDDTTPLTLPPPPKHWSYSKPARPTAPAVKDASWVRNPIDNFILAKLEKEGLEPAPEAKRTTLLRRVYLDLTGLPPSPQEVDNFLNDKSPDAYEKVVDRLLASPHYGERWARQWLDLARYADSNGYEKDRRRTAWEYRDWVIRALNTDLSFRDFTIQQIAGDMLPNPTKDQLIATGFNRNSMLNQEGGIDVNEYYYYSLVDRVNTTASVWLGSTLGCAQCHNHKFDPFPQKDYYRFLAFFSHSEHHIEGTDDRWMAESELALPTPDQEKESKKLQAEIGSLQEKLDTQTPELDQAEAAWEQAMHKAVNEWTVLKPSSSQSTGGATLRVLQDGSILASGTNPMADTYVLEAPVPASAITGVRLEVLPDPSLPKGGPGRDPAGNFFLSDFQVEIAPANNRAASQPLVWKSAVADESQEGYSIKNLVGKKSGQLTGWAIKEGNATPLSRQAVFLTSPPAAHDGGVFIITMKHQMRHASRNIGRFRLSVTGTADPAFIAKIPAAIRPLLDTPATLRTPAQKQQIAAAYRAVSPLLDPTRGQIKLLKEQIQGLGINTAMVMREEPDFLRPSAYIRERGTFTSPGELVYADVPAALNPLPKDAMPNRLGLAEWLVSPDNPLTARVTVNHYWEAIFGHGIVETSEDFGTQGDPPSHPELLDWLAREFMQNGWSPKRIQRLMVTSATYRQDSRVTPQLLARDPYNKLYAHGPRFRVDAETVHDIALAESGLLSEKMFGPPVFPYQPEGVWDIPYSNEKWVESKNEDRHRRALYTTIRRSAPYPSLVTYDAPSREFCTVRRVRTNTPLQALTSLNDPYFFEAARALAKRLEHEGGPSVSDRIKYGFRLTVSRAPSPAELDRVATFYQQQKAEYLKHPESAYQVIGMTTETPSEAAQAAAWTMVANVLLNTDEAITKE
jgi:mono/diheme cytochrome c family protein